jgi:hypothetical protein
MKRKRKCRSRDIAQLISLFLYLSLQDDLFLSWKHRIPCLEAWLDREGSKKTDIWMDGWIGMRERVVQSHCIEIIERAFIHPFSIVPVPLTRSTVLVWPVMAGLAKGRYESEHYMLHDGLNDPALDDCAATLSQVPHARSS